MNNIDLQNKKQILEEKLKTVIEELKTLGVYDPQTDDWRAVPDKENVAEADQNSNADDLEDSEERQSTLTTLEIEYRNLKKALDKIENNTYGLCEICGKPIEENRLQIKPDARTCIEHMDEEENLAL